ncbi:thrombospondin type 3 repeat-containing protein [Sinanaerobacter chloroacetimidivorans]|uniref:Uncharacterized protein n=1 Tax=Sinanaerobacter chloroacetimidivorans TaxID=2818044 RepID=A0A8J8B290_9FIRM|nr:thrombospondin type 3 repeat-containing protein [Sinanaerobacter chloroacetimidivorans]MBR0598477.1 hypothetical protein [Sinanaerobacter chloroacetimidivorans]
MKNLKTNITVKTVVTVLLILSVMSLGLVGCGSGSNQTADSGSNTNSTQPAVTNNTGGGSTDTDGDGIPNDVEKTYGTNPYIADTDGDGVNDKVDKDPVNTENLIKETSTAPLEVTIKDARVEDNATADHLEITMTNTGKTDLANFDIYYTITDKANNTQESYYQTLGGLTLAAGETKTIHFDNQVSEAGHYYGNMNGLYGTSSNGLTFDIQLHAAGFKPMGFTVEKSKGTAEVAD